MTKAKTLEPKEGIQDVQADVLEAKDSTDSAVPRPAVATGLASYVHTTRTPVSPDLPAGTLGSREIHLQTPPTMQQVRAAIDAQQAEREAEDQRGG